MSSDRPLSPGRHHRPDLVVVGEQDLLTPPWQAKKVADAIPGARYELLTGPGSSHGLHIERPEDLVRLGTAVIREHALAPSS